jgi:small-conductance mechanosensitive channel
MGAYIGPLIIGIICIILGIVNMRGNISSLHSYHRRRVSPENALPFGRLVGLGTIIIGIAIIMYGTLSTLALLLEKELLSTVGMVVMGIGLVVGLLISFYAMEKYNGGIF